MSRKVLTLEDLLNVYDNLTIHNEGFAEMPKITRKLLWDDWIDKYFPEVKDCHFCGSSMNSGLLFLPEVAMQSWHISGRIAEIQCENCNMSFKGEFGTGRTVVEQWNDINITTVGDYDTN